MNRGHAHRNDEREMDLIYHSMNRLVDTRNTLRLRAADLELLVIG